ncbi:nucleotidyl transferase AbiEii/AbiGii toxin family protein [Streptomyces yangpuensis]|uniref:nucleotidyl transferase AbiEii/AbiGii toxin family protein n=1 Tax=Streptomyces yangpuensis TaxID=1648182 RepID=UPI00380EC572
MKLSDLHRRLLTAVIDIDAPYPLVITGGYAVQAHECEVDVLKEHFWTAPVQTEYGPVLAFDSVIGTKVRALADRGAVRDLIDVHAASRHRTLKELERLGERHGRGEFRLHDLRDRLAGADWADDEEFYAYGLTEDGTAELRAWAQRWVSDLEQRLHDHDGDA